MYRKSDHDIGNKIPNGYNSNGKYLAEVKIHFEFTDKHPQYQGIDQQADKRNQDKLRIFHSNVWICTLESPNPV